MLKCCFAATSHRSRPRRTLRFCNMLLEVFAGLSATTPLPWSFACFLNQPSTRSLEHSARAPCPFKLRTGNFGNPGSATPPQWRISMLDRTQRSPCRLFHRTRCRIREARTDQRSHNAGQASPSAARTDGISTDLTAATVTTPRSTASFHSKKLGSQH